MQRFRPSLFLAAPTAGRSSRVLWQALTFGSACIVASGCSATPGPDKSIAGGLLGAAWGAGAGAIVGHQTGSAGPGAGIGAGFGAVSGAIYGVGLDLAEGTELDQQRQIDVLKIQTLENERNLRDIQARLDSSEQIKLPVARPPLSDITSVEPADKSSKSVETNTKSSGRY